MNKSLQEIYDGFAKTYEANRGLFDISDILDSFHSKLAGHNGHLLDLGCGAGEPVARYFLDNKWSVTGVDLSEQMLKLAAHYVPEMKTLHSDFTDIEFNTDQFDAITATYSLFHIPSEQHVALFEKLYQWLAPNGKALFTYACKEYTGSEEFTGYKKFMDQELFYSHKAPETLFADLENIGFKIDAADYHNIGNETFLWVTVSK